MFSLLYSDNNHYLKNCTGCPGQPPSLV